MSIAPVDLADRTRRGPDRRILAAGVLSPRPLEPGSDNACKSQGVSGLPNHRLSSTGAPRGTSR